MGAVFTARARCCGGVAAAGDSARSSPSGENSKGLPFVMWMVRSHVAIGARSPRATAA